MKIPPKVATFSEFNCIFTMSLMELNPFLFASLSEVKFLTWQNYVQHIVAQVFINFIKQKRCGIKDLSQPLKQSSDDETWSKGHEDSQILPRIVCQAVGGALAGMWALALWHADTAHDQSMALKAMIQVDEKVLVPSVMIILVAGITYGVFTNFGFFKFRWVIVKWILTLALVLVGTFHFNPTVLASITELDNAGDSALQSAVVTNGIRCARLSGIQFAVIIAIVLISVFKPWKKKTSMRDKA